MTSAVPFRRDRVLHGWILLKALSDAGDAAWYIAVAWTAVTLGSPVIAGLVVTAGTVPRAITLLFGGVLADRLDPRRLMLVATGARIVVLAATLASLVIGGESLPLLFVAAIAFGVCDALFEPAGAAFTRQIVRDDDFGAYAGVGQTASRIGGMLGSAAGGMLVAVGGLAAAAAVNGVAYAAVLAYLGFVLRARRTREPAPPEPIGRAIAGGFGYLRRDRLARSLVLSLLGLNVCSSPAMSVGIALLVQRLDGGPGTLGALEATFGLAAMVGSVACVRWKPRRPAFASFVLLVAQGLAVASFALGSLPAAFVAGAVVGLTAGAASVQLSALFMLTIDPSHLGRVSSIQRLGDDGLMPLATAAFGALASLSLPLTFVAFGGAMSAYMAASAARWRRAPVTPSHDAIR